MKLRSIAVTLLFIVSTAAVAQAQAVTDSRIIGQVTVESEYGNGTLSAPVREAEYGLQVQLPSGNWLYCEKGSLVFGRDRPCSETLRREFLDFWESIDEEPSQ